ncbi:MAG: hypothetical protein WCG26_01555 [Chloroflexales bacterium]
MANLSWRDKAARVIAQALADAAAQDLDEAATLRLVDSRYPFGERAHHPYTQWLAARRALVPSVRRKANLKARDAWVQASGQGEIFDAPSD